MSIPVNLTACSVKCYKPPMAAREKILKAKSDHPEIPMVDLARIAGVSRQRVHQILKSAGFGRINRIIGNTRRAEYRCWWNMLDRCLNPNNKEFKYYGKRGISVCARWRDFENFFADMGSKPSKNLTIERINNDGDYSPSNCKWATHMEQSKNKRAWGTAS